MFVDTAGAARRARIHLLDVPLRNPFRIAFETVTHAENFLAVVQDGDEQGYGEGAPVPAIVGETRAEALDAATAWLGSGLAAIEDPRDMEAFEGLASPSARAAVEGAVLDAAARREGVPLATYLTGASIQPITTSITLPLVEQEKLAPLVEAYQRQGFTAFKVKAGLGVTDDLNRIATIRSIVGPDAELRVDPNQGWTREQAAEALPVLRDIGVSFLEQPLHRADLEGHAELRRLDEVPIMLDESVFSPDDAERAIKAGAADLINIKLQKCGGLLPGLRIADIAEAAGIQCMVGCMLETRVAITQAAHLVAAHDNILYADLDGATFLENDPVRGGARIVGGRVQFPYKAGLGIDRVYAGPEVTPLLA